MTEEIVKGIEALFPAGTLVELRIPNKSGTVVGYFTDHEKLAEAISQKSGKVPAVYYTLNTPDPSLYENATYKDEARVGSNSTGDNQIIVRNWMLIDCDPVRVDSTGKPLTNQKVSSTDEEKEKSLAVAKSIYVYLKSVGWPAPTTADSGNGYHLLYNLGGLPNTPELTLAIKNALISLAAKFDTPFVKVDTTVYNPSRITKAYGSMACKGPHTDDRPHRTSGIRTVAGKSAVTLPQILALTPTDAPAPAKKPGIVIKGKQLFGYAVAETMLDKMEEFFDFYELDYKPRHREPKGYKWQLIPCPFNPEHSNGEVAVFLNDDGGYGFKCFHNSCEANHWQELRSFLEQKTDKKFFFTTNSKEAVPAHVDTKSALVFEKASGIKPEVLNWLWPNRVPFGKLTMLVGHPGIGKGMVTMYLVARATTETGWHDVQNTNPPMDALIISSEDAGGDTIVPRLMAAGADLERVYVFKVTKTVEGEKGFGLDTDLPALRKMLEDNPKIKLVIIDPIMNHLGKLKANSEQELRSALTPLGKLAEKFGVAIVLVSHFNKTQGNDAIQRVGGAMGMVGAVRISWSFSEDKDTGVRQMLPIKANLSKNEGGLEYKIESKEVEIDGQMVSVGAVKFGKQTHASIDSALKGDGSSTKIGKAIIWLADFMSDGLNHSKDVVIAAGELKGFEDFVTEIAYEKLDGDKPQGEGDACVWKISKKGNQ